MDRKSEFLKGLKETRKYIFSHHEPEEYYRCYRVDLLGRTERICARCAGIYPGLALGYLSFLMFQNIPFWIVALSGLPTIIEKYITGVKHFRGYNFLRSGSGFILGFGFVQGVFYLWRNPLDLEILSVGLLYGIISLLLIYLESKES